MKRLILGVCAVVIACGGGRSTGGSAPVAVQGYSATRWIPQDAAFAMAARSVRDAQRSTRDFFVTFAELRGLPAFAISSAFRQTLGLDPLSPEDLAKIGVDLDGGMAVSSDGTNLTLAMHLVSRDQLVAFLDAQPQLKSRRSVVVDGIDVASVPIDDMLLSWAVVDGWLLAHFSFETEPTPAWLGASRHGGRGWWIAELEAMKAKGAPPIIGVGDNVRFEPDKDATPMARCLRQQLPHFGQGHFRIAIASDDQHTSASLSADLGASAATVEAMTLPVPEGWAASTAQVPIAAQMNVDLAAATSAIGPCLQQAGVDLRQFQQLGIRAGRGYLRTFDPEDRKPTGALSLDLAHKDFLAAQLDEVPMRSTFERNRTFGPYAGKSLAIPMYMTIDYVLNDQLALAAIGDGLLLKLVGKGGGQKGPLFELALQPRGLSIESWVELLQLIGVDRPKNVAEALQKWREARLTARMDGTWLVFELAGTRQ